MTTKEKGSIALIGKVKVGLGRGRFFVRQKEYRRQFIKKLGIDPYYGTLNIRLSPKNMRKLQRIKKGRPILIKGFRKGGKSFGDVLGYRAEMYGIKCALIIPKLSTHTEVAEVISSKKLRSALGLKEGSRTEVIVKV